MTQAPSITFVSHTSQPGGGELALRRYLQATDLSVRLVTLEGGGVWEGLEREVVHAKGLRGLSRALRGGGLVVANSMRAAFLTALVAPRKTRLIYWVRDGLTDSAMSSVALTLTKQVTARRATHYIANSEWTAQTVRDALQVGPDRVDVVHSMCGLTDEMLQAPPRRRAHSPVRLLFLGRLSPWKGPDVAVRALAPLRQLGISASLTIAGASHFGEHDYERQVKDLATTEPGVTLVGHVDDIQPLLHSHDVLVHCSTVPEPFGQVIVQGLAAGMAVVATDHGGPLEILQQSSRTVTYRPGDADALAATISKVLSAFPSVSSENRVNAFRYADSVAAATTDSVLARIAFGEDRQVDVSP